jgi:hypothetical protein
MLRNFSFRCRPRPVRGRAEFALIGAGTYLAGLGAIISYVGGVSPRLEPRQRNAVLERKSDRLNPAWSLVSWKQNMRAPLSPLLLAAAWLSAAWFAGAGCAGAPKEESQAAAKERACTNDASGPLHMASSRPYVGSDPQIESILNQPADPRLAWVNRQMYQSLHTLDVELRREQRVAACEHPESSAPTLEAQSGNGAAAGGGSSPGLGAAGGAVAMVGGAGGGTGPSGGTGSAAATETNGATASPAATPAPTTPAANSASTTAASAAPQNPMVNAAAPGAARATLIRKTSLSATGGGGNGATAPKITAVSDNDIVARRLRKAAEQETNPTLRAKLWKEYTDYRQGMAAK